MKAAVLYGARDMRLEDRPVPTFGDDEVLLKVAACGVCGSDVHYFAHGRIGDQVVESPMPVGHEVSAFVADFGSAVEGLEKGQRVAVDPARPCGACEQCLHGRQNCCPNVRFFGTPPVDGTFQEYYAVSPRQCIPIPANMTMAEAAFLEPLLVGVHANNMVPTRPGESCVIIGAGPIGLSCMLMAKASGASPLIVTDKLDYRLDLAAKMGAVHTINVTKDEPAEAIQDITGGGAHCLFDCTNTSEGLPQAIASGRIGSRVAWVGITGEDTITIEPHVARRKQLLIQLIRRSVHGFPQGLRLMADGIIDVKPMITHHLPLARIHEAFDMVEHYADGVVKAMIHLAQEDADRPSTVRRN